MPLLYHAYVYLEFLILACTIYILAPPFEETVRRHNTRDKKQEFGEEDMRRWWREKDFSSVFNEKIITSDIDADSIVEMIYMDSANEG